MANYIFSDAVLEDLSFHDASIHAMKFASDSHLFFLDIDYIIEWVAPQGEEAFYKFWIAPATLVFRNTHQTILDTSTMELVIESLFRENPITPINASYINDEYEYDWTILLTSGVIKFKSTGFQLYLRREASLESVNQLSVEERGGISFLMP